MKIQIHALCTIDSIRDGEHWRMGTGFVFLQRNWLVTAKHVVWDDTLQTLRNDLFVQSTDPKTKANIVSAIKFYLHPEYDLAVLELSEPICERPLYPAHQAAEEHDNLFAIGFSPSSSAVERINFSVIKIRSFETEYRERDLGTEELIEFELEGAEGGNSGGPILGDGAGIVAVIGHGVQPRNNENGSTTSKVRATGIQTIVDSLNFSLNWEKASGY